MNKLNGVISTIRSSGALYLVEISVFDDILSAVVLDDSCDCLSVGKKIQILFKETEVAVATDFSGQISLRNRLKCKVIDVQKGAILTSIKLDYEGTQIASIITTASAESLGIESGLWVTALIKTNELMLMGT